MHFWSNILPFQFGIIGIFSFLVFDPKKTFILSKFPIFTIVTLSTETHTNRVTIQFH